MLEMLPVWMTQNLEQNLSRRYHHPGLVDRYKSFMFTTIAVGLNFQKCFFLKQTTGY